MKKLMALLAVVVIIVAFTPLNSVSKALTYNEAHKNVKDLYGALLDSLFKAYDKNEDNSIAFAMLLDYYYNGYILSGKLDNAMEMVKLDEEAGFGSLDMIMQKDLEEEFRQRNVTNMIYESLVNGEIDPKKYIEGIRYAYEASKAK